MSGDFKTATARLFRKVIEHYETAKDNFVEKSAPGFDHVTAASIGTMVEPGTGKKYGYKLIIGRPGQFDEEEDD